MYAARKLGTSKLVISLWCISRALSHGVGFLDPTIALFLKADLGGIPHDKSWFSKYLILSKALLSLFLFLSASSHLMFPEDCRNVPSQSDVSSMFFRSFYLLIEKDILRRLSCTFLRSFWVSLRFSNGSISSSLEKGAVPLKRLLRWFWLCFEICKEVFTQLLTTFFFGSLMQRDS